MAIDITGNIDRFEAGDTRQFTLTMTGNPPSSAQFVLFNTDGNTLALPTVQANEIVNTSATGVFYFNQIIPDTPNFYNYKWTAWDSASKPYVTAGEFEVIRTEAHSFFTYSNIHDVLRTARQIFGRGDITAREIRDYNEAADGVIDSRLGIVTTVPLTSASALIRDMSKVYTLWMYYSDRHSVEKQDAPPAIIARKNAYDELLDAIVAGSATIAGVALVDNGEVFAIPDGTKKAVFDMRDFSEQEVSRTLIEEEDAKVN